MCIRDRLIPEEKIGDLDFSEWNTENPYIGKQFWIHKKRASNFLPSSVISSSPYVNVKVTGFSKVSNASYKANGIKKIEKIYVEVNGTSYECDIQLVTPPSSFTDSTEALKPVSYTHLEHYELSEYEKVLCDCFSRFIREHAHRKCSLVISIFSTLIV